MPYGQDHVQISSHRPGDDIDWVAAGEGIRVIPPGKQAAPETPQSRLRLFDQATERHRSVHWRVRRSGLVTEAGPERTYTRVAALVDTNILVYRFDNRFPGKQKIATDILRRGIAEDSVRVPHQAIIEFIAAVTRPIRGHIILKRADALREAEEAEHYSLPELLRGPSA